VPYGVVVSRRFPQQRVEIGAWDVRALGLQVKVNFSERMEKKEDGNRTENDQYGDRWLIPGLSELKIYCWLMRRSLWTKTRA